ncbi:acyltransferase family protein [Microbulbifer echini]|uniref:Acyltransferase family protein n=1 Tax=Microbulbifer echini TaxID=1529067 RepID=A0ABV4NRS8_9GAMM
MIEYRKDIDGLRALAVLGVVGAHLGFEQLKGGFVGVDVFFVISGYLITALLTKEFRLNQTVNFGSFFWRRIRRLVPAVLATVGLTVIAAFLLFSKEQFESTVWSSITAILSISNIYFWSSVGYFDADAISKPLLHTWSLGVEEQFYLFWPFVLIGLLKLNRLVLTKTAIFVLFSASFALNALFISGDLGAVVARQSKLLVNFNDGGTTAFYWFPFRIFEFMVGAGLVFIGPGIGRLRKSVADFLVLLGTSIIVLYMVLLSEDAVFPYYNALVVAAGTGLIIWAGKDSGIAGLVFGNHVARFFGRVSYSLYLVHWPIIVFFVSLGGDLTSLQSKLVLLALTILAGYLLYFTVENPMRNASYLTVKPLTYRAVMQRASLPACAALMAMLALVAKDYEDRIPVERKTLTNSEWRKFEREKYCTGEMPEFPKDIFTCQNDRNSSETIVVWGDSHALHTVAGISEIFPDTNIAIAYMPGCIPQSGFNGLVRDMKRKDLTESCIKKNRQFLNWASDAPKPVLTLITSAKRNTPKQIAEINHELTSYLSKSGHNVYILGDFIRPEMKLAQCRAVPDFFHTEEMLSRICGPKLKAVSKEVRYNLRLAELTPNYISVIDIQCPDDECIFTNNGKALHRDNHHLSPYGSITLFSDVRMLKKFMGLGRDVRGLISSQLIDSSSADIEPRG